MHQLERITPAKNLAWREVPSEYKKAVGHIEYLLWETGGELPLSVELHTDSDVVLQIVIDYSQDGYSVFMHEQSPTQFLITLSKAT